MIERGRLVEHRKDYITEAKPPWQYKNRTKVAFDLVDDQYKIQRQCYAFHDGTKHFFGNDKDYSLHYKSLGLTLVGFEQINWVVSPCCGIASLTA